MEEFPIDSLTHRGVVLREEDVEVPHVVERIRNRDEIVPVRQSEREPLVELVELLVDDRRVEGSPFHTQLPDGGGVPGPEPLVEHASGVRVRDEDRHLRGC